jgi:hypothetical protein
MHRPSPLNATGSFVVLAGTDSSSLTSLNTTMHHSILGVSRGASAVSGLIGTVVFPAISLWLGRVERIAVVSVWLVWLTLMLVVAAFCPRASRRSRFMSCLAQQSSRLRGS